MDNLHTIDINYDELTELIKAIEIAYQYRVNTIRIRRLLASHPITINNGQALYSETYKRYIIHMFSGKQTTYISDMLKS